MIRVVVAAPPAVQAPDDLALLPPAADWIELRMDLLGIQDLRPWVEASPRPVLATLRSTKEGGRFPGDPRTAARILGAGAAAGAAAIDVELPVAPHVASLPDGTEVVVSYHGEGDPVWPVDVAGRPYRKKLARLVADAAGWERLRQESGLPFGPLGALRAATVGEGGLLYGHAGDAVVRGQPGLLELLDELRAGEVTKDAALFGLLGRPPNHSPSPAIHNAAFRSLGRDALYVPLPDVDPAVALTLPFQGFSVTTPHKAEACRLADSHEGWAYELGVANTLRRDPDGRWRASNTDADAIQQHLPPEAEGATALVWGAGAYARTAVHVLRAEGFVPRLAARNAERGRTVARALDVEWMGTAPKRLETDRVLVNATPLGAGGETPVPFNGWTFEDLVVQDAPYAARGCETGLARLARATAARFVDGGALLRAQAFGQAQRFLPKLDPEGLERLIAVLPLALEAPPPLVLLGLRGAGKSRVGRLVAQRLGRPFLDLDEEVERLTDHPPSWWLRERGEAAFRDRELRVVQGLVGRRGVVVAAGGGVLEHPDAAAILAEHTWPVWLDVPPAVAAGRARRDGTDRPALVPGVSEEEEADVLHARRRAGWRAVSHAVIDGTPDPETVAEAVARTYVDAWLAAS